MSVDNTTKSPTEHGLGDLWEGDAKATGFGDFLTSGNNWSKPGSATSTSKRTSAAFGGGVPPAGSSLFGWNPNVASWGASALNTAKSTGWGLGSLTNAFGAGGNEEEVTAANVSASSPLVPGSFDAEASKSKDLKLDLPPASLDAKPSNTTVPPTPTTPGNAKARRAAKKAEEAARKAEEDAAAEAAKKAEEDAAAEAAKKAEEEEAARMADEATNSAKQAEDEALKEAEEMDPWKTTTDLETAPTTQEPVEPEVTPSTEITPAEITPDAPAETSEVSPAAEPTSDPASATAETSVPADAPTVEGIGNDAQVDGSAEQPATPAEELQKNSEGPVGGEDEDGAGEDNDDEEKEEMSGKKGKKSKRNSAADMSRAASQASGKGKKKKTKK